MASVIKKCTCKHDAQDEFHGAGMRVYNSKAKATGKKQDYTCTVCGKTHSESAE